MRVSNLVLPDIREELERNPSHLDSALRDFHPADLAEVLNDLDSERALAVLQHVPADLLPETFDYLDLSRRVALLSALPLAVAAAIAERMAADERTDLFADLPEDLREALLARMRPEDSREVVQLLEYPPTSAGGLMTTEYLAYPADLAAADLLRRIRFVAKDKESIYTIYLTDPADGRLVGVMSLRDLLLAEPHRPARELMEENVMTVGPDTDQEEVARVIAKYDLLQLPVVDERNGVLGVVTVDDILDVLVQEGTEDVQRIAAVTPTEEPYLAASFLGMVRRRAGWLTFLFVGEMLTATAMGYFEGAIARAVVLALFVPLIISSGGNSGSQATSLIIRAMAVGEVRLRHWWRVLARELATGVVLGILLGCIALARILVWPHHEVLYVRALRPHRRHRRRQPDRRRHIRHLHGLDAALSAAAPRLRSGDGLGALRRHARRRHRAGNLLQHRSGHPPRHAALILLRIAFFRRRTEEMHRLVQLGMAADQDQHVAAFDAEARPGVGQRLPSPQHGDDSDPGFAAQSELADGAAGSRRHRAGSARSRSESRRECAARPEGSAAASAGRAACRSAPCE